MDNKRKTTLYENQSNDLLHNLHDFLAIHNKVRPRSETLKIIIIYVFFGGLWILLSDMVLGYLVKDAEMFRKIQLYKGWIYVVISSVIFYFIISRKMKLFKSAIDKIYDGYKQLSTSHEELMTMDEEMSQQFEEIEAHRNALLISDQRYQLAVEGANDGIWDWDINADTYFLSIKFKNTLGYVQGELEDTIEGWKKIVHPHDMQENWDKLNEYLISQKDIYESTYRIRNKNGNYRWILSHGKGIWDVNGEPIRISGSHTDITKQIEIQELLRKEKEISESIINDAPMIILIVDTCENIIQFNPFAENTLGYKKEEVLGKNIIEILATRSNRESMRKTFNMIIAGESSRNLEMETRCKDGRNVIILWNNNLLHDTEGNIQGAVSIGIDITDRRQMENKLQLMAYHDSLTQLPNREMLKETAEQQIVYAKENNKKLAFLYLDIDNFKHINDTMGHAIGDKLIIHIGNILSALIKSPNTVARLGGDEFAIILADIENIDMIVLELNLILEQIKKPWILDGKNFFVSVSVGVAVYPDHSTDLSALMQNADAAMFHIKENGKDGFCIFTSDMHEKTVQHIQMRNLLISAINNQEFLLYYQPQIDLYSGKVIGVEALIRWVHPEKGFIPPMQFIPFAENTGYICQIDEWVLKTACSQKKKWEEQGYQSILMSVNLSGIGLMQDGLVTKIQKILKGIDTDACKIVLEITETAVMTNLEKAIEVLREIKKLGITIALDDFGTGYSSLTYLQKLPIDILKIDREFVRDIINTDEESYIFKSIVDLAHNMGLEVLAEGVETKEQEGFIIKNGCDVGQGYYFSRPKPASEIEMLIS